jgi:hypothetical protein
MHAIGIVVVPGTAITETGADSCDRARLYGRARTTAVKSRRHMSFRRSPSP